ncbi:Lrp/AsnC family transcriptional regulator [Phytohabitans suffuscus]|uniref:AsnC family transcriptional regulator n=1 Tax=Phytohabitans suffuscus TaxID=624315 RepID=A0A6F8YX54_9ACTN|nr:Lrp/AsnC family transcriptional regulator [Phytohabitans suffuscus]BCB90717.1 AsnC family transcriptional regulator [Phytohabitans suffuscus]
MDRQIGTAAGSTAPAARQPLDDVDRRMVAELVKDGRMAVRTLAERLHISRANAYSRLGRLVRDRVIRGFSVRLDPAQVGLTTAVYVTMQIEQNAWRDVRERLTRLPAIQHFALTGGAFDIIALARVPDQAHLRALILDEIQSIPGVRNTQTQLVFEEVPDEMLLP